jgi:hypothetical protein
MIQEEGRRQIMKRITFSVGTVILSGLLATAWAADISGKWTAQVAGAQGQPASEITFIFTADGTNLTGTINNSLAPGEVAIQEGKIDGDKVSFSLSRNMGGGEMKVVWQGELSGDEIKFVRSVQGGMAGGAGGPGGGMKTEIIAKRAQ